MRIGDLRMEGVAFSYGRARILDGLNLRFKRGEVTAVLGPSGSGKSTLIKCLATVLRPGEGRVTTNGADLFDDVDAFRLQLGYVPQDDVIHRQLRVEDALYYAGRLRLKQFDRGSVLEARIETVLAGLGLEERRRHRIRSLSGGQRKRVNIGVELLADPQVLVLDEPASGLDPAIEEDLVRLLRRMAEAGRTIVLTTHSMERLADYDKLVFVAAGRVVYAGPPDKFNEHFEVDDPSDAYRVLRDRGLEEWESRYRASDWARGEER
jgi:ABC-type multidrug transport system ATPase subunit